MYYSFYMNEKMLLDNWKYYQSKGECNWLLRTCVAKDKRLKGPNEKKAFYLTNRRERDFKYLKNDEFHQKQLERAKWMLMDTGFYYDDESCFDNCFDTRSLNIYRREIELNDKAEWFMDFSRDKEYQKKIKLREITSIDIFKSDIQWIQEKIKLNDLTMPQIECIFGLVFFSRMYKSEKCNLFTPWKQKQFLACFDRVTVDDFDYVVDKFFGKCDDGDIKYMEEHDDNRITIKVTKRNNRLNLTKMAHKYIPHIDDRKYCKVCLKPFTPTNNRQKVCPVCKDKADKALMPFRKNKQRFIKKYGKDACLKANGGSCRNCTNPLCNNWYDWHFDLFEDIEENDDTVKAAIEAIKRGLVEEKDRELGEFRPLYIQHLYRK